MNGSGQDAAGLLATAAASCRPLHFEIYSVLALFGTVPSTQHCGHSCGAAGLPAGGAVVGDSVWHGVRFLRVNALEPPSGAYGIVLYPRAAVYIADSYRVET